MTLTELRYLVNLDKDRHFGRAAERSFVSQPTLSVAVKKLEDELGVLLFERHRGEVRPTLVGERIIVQAKRVLAETRRLEDIAREGQDEISGPLRFGAIYTVGPYLLPALVPLLHQRAPQMPLIIEENFTARLMEQLRENELDVIAVALPVDLTGLVTWPVYDEEFVVVMPPEHPLADKAQITSRQLGSEKLLLLGPGHCFRDQVIEACPKCVTGDEEGPRPQTGSSLETIRHMVVSGLGITVLPRSSVDSRSDDQWLTTRPFVDPVPQRRIALVWRKTFPRRKAIRALRAAIFDAAIAGVKNLPDEAEPGE
ncbi:hydrogen peroxide-inducible genes activator [Sinimarinibacterium sp. NLF-5-8]|uniref:hydrogen peroxide-inducible genes activator n=1 Tax=Sinimarinibacterium sp. NLF-5-8 TaxID=2698684 RepID=UPI00137C19B4|nr:hydrogen peroxide-inducible genes activator [Sinimarinibacterium sp. NLF-5-8]QHS10650.1 hydrogen peroxide-inducible genes activator [Sinimarinibacterium sp. NLF-5-8]